MNSRLFIVAVPSLFLVLALAQNENASRRASVCVGGVCPVDSVKPMEKSAPALATKVYGKIQVVTAFPDYKVQVVESLPDLRVQIVEAFPNAPGKWQLVDAFPDYKIQFVEAFPDFKIQFVDAFPGPPN